MYNKLTILMLLSTLFSLQSCWKSEDDSSPRAISGVVYQTNTTIPVPNARVVLYQTLYSKSFGGPSITTTLDTCFADSLGRYAFEFTPSENSSPEYTLLASAYNFEKTLPYEVENRKKVNIFITPYAWVKIRVLNRPPVELGDHIDVGGWIRDGSSKAEDFGKSGPCDTTFVQRVHGNQKTEIFYWHDSNITPSTFKSDSVFCKGLDTTYHEILY